MGAIGYKYARLGTDCFCSTHQHRNLPIIAQAVRLSLGLIALVAFQWMGELVVAWAGIIIPGPLIGMLLLLVVLVYPSRLTSLVQPISTRLIQNLSLLFIPACVGAFFLSRSINLQLPMLLLTVIISTPLTMIAMTLLIRSIKGQQDD